MKFLNDIVKWGIIGAGNVCEKKSGPAFNKVPDSELVAVMRRNALKAEDYARRHGVPKYYSRAEDLISDPEINAIYIATPPAFHATYALDAIEHGKPVYIEKPVTLDAGGCELLIEASELHKVPAAVAHYRRRLSLFLKLRELIETGVIGPVKLITLQLLQSPENNLTANTEENWRVVPSVSGGGIFHDLAPHQLDIMNWLFGKPLSYKGASFNQGKHFDAPDTTTLQVHYAGEIFLDGLWSFNVSETTMEDRCEIFGEKGKLSFSFFRNPELEIHSARGIEKLHLPYPEHIQQPMIADVVKYFRGKIPNPSPLEEALWTMQMMDCTLL